MVGLVQTSKRVKYLKLNSALSAELQRSKFSDIFCLESESALNLIAHSGFVSFP